MKHLLEGTYPGQPPEVQNGAVPWRELTFIEPLLCARLSAYMSHFILTASL